MRILIIITCLLVCSISHADTIYLKNGSVMNNANVIKIDEDKNAVTVEIYGGTTELNMMEIEKIEHATESKKQIEGLDKRQYCSNMMEMLEKYKAIHSENTKIFKYFSETQDKEKTISKLKVLEQKLDELEIEISSIEPHAKKLYSKQQFLLIEMVKTSKDVILNYKRGLNDSNLEAMEEALRLAMKLSIELNDLEVQFQKIVYVDAFQGDESVSLQGGISTQSKSYSVAAKEGFSTNKVKTAKYSYKNDTVTYWEITSRYANDFIEPKLIGVTEEGKLGEESKTLVKISFSVKGVNEIILSAPESEVSTQVKNKLKEAVPNFEIIWEIDNKTGDIEPYNYYAKDAITVYKENTETMIELNEAFKN